VSVVVVDHHDSYTWNLVHLVAAVTGELPTVVQHDETSARRVLGFSHVVLSPGPGTPTQPADFAVGRDVLLAGSRRHSTPAACHVMHAVPPIRFASRMPTPTEEP